MFKLVHHIENFAFQTTKNYCSICIWQTEKGFFLYSVLIATSIFMTLAMLWASYMALTVKTWFQVYNEMVLCDAGKYIQGVLEKDLGYESTLINVRKDSRNLHMLECQNVYGNKTITIYMEDVRLLKKIKTGNGTGTNTLYINGCNVEDWSVEALDTKNLRISFCLKKNECKKFFQQIVYCYNGEVTINA